ncbi:hypothetical protein [Bacillus amyloliquefaciens]|uniref:hypothetical protein n=1 Tax=Bacillus amyloliquefaciens TaxID=1390 RepID=UPI001CD77C13|nr:hypothetical protein [Bacillus amyloliquefaciens]
MAPAGEHRRRKRPAFTKRSGMYRQRCVVKSPWLIEAAGAAGFGSRPGAGFFVSRAGNGPPWLLKEIRGCRFRCGAGRRTSEGENAPRLRSDRECTGSAAS